MARMKKLGGLFIVREILFLTDAKADGGELTQNGRRKKEEEHYRFQREWTLKKIKNKGMKTSLSTLSRGWEGGRGKVRDGAGMEQSDNNQRREIAKVKFVVPGRG